MVDKPDVDKIEGLSPAISIEQKSTSHNPRSTVGTVTEIYDYLRLLYARIGEPKCPEHKLVWMQCLHQICIKKLLGNCKRRNNIYLIACCTSTKRRAC